MLMGIGDKLGPYEILALLGAGGMGEVYKARDTRLDRFVAIKVLLQHIAMREEFRSRFEREARAVASLNHPNICVLHDIGSQAGVSYMVMELLEGETLATRISKGAIPLDQALRLAERIADALDRSHRTGVTHRDLKPGNIMLTGDGVKVLDFGLAKSVRKLGPDDATLTANGAVVGTPQYMAPEQFGGGEADARTDVWAFGLVFYEMVTGQKAFQGKSYSSLMGAILSADPAPMALKPFTPAWLERLVRQCLAKDPEDRWQSMRDVVLELKSPPAESAVQARSTRFSWLAVVALATLAATLAVIHFREAPPVQPVLVASIQPPDKAVFKETVISPDGKLLAFTATSEGKRQLWVRPLHTLAAQALAGTEQAEYPFWSPDSHWIGFFAQGKLKKISAAGGPAQTLCDLTGGRGGAWNADDLILYADMGTGLSRVPAQGGRPERVTIPDRSKGEISHRAPVFLPGGRRYVYLVDGSKEATGIYLGVLNSQERTRLLRDESSPDYAVGPAGEGYLLFVRDGTLMAQQFDAGRGSLVGEAFMVAEKVGVDAVRSRASFSVSGNGTLVYESNSSEDVRLTWMDHGGKRLKAVGEPFVGGPTDVSLSPDEKQIAFTRQGAGQTYDIWVRDLARDIETRLTFHPGIEWSPIWSPDGGRIVFSSNREGAFDLYAKNASGAGQEDLLLRTGNDKDPTDWVHGGRLVYQEQDPETRFDLWVLPLEGERKPEVFLRTSFDERDGAFAPDARWIAYTSDESGRNEIYVQPYPATGAKWLVSKDGGHWPRWRPDGKEMYWLDGDGRIMAAEVSLGSAFRSAIPQPLFETGLTHPFGSYVVSRDRSRFLVTMPVNETDSRPATVVWNWLAASTR